MTVIKPCYRELQGIRAHFRQIQKDANVQDEKKSAVLQILPIKTKSEGSPAGQRQNKADEPKQPGLKEAAS